MTENKYNFLDSNYLIIILLAVHFLINLAIYFNTNTFYEISESGAIFDAYYLLINGRMFLPMYHHLFLTPAFIAYFIGGLTGGGLFPYFIFHIVLSTITVYILYKFILYITASRKKAILSVILMMFYLEYSLLSSIFYNQLYEIFFVLTLSFSIIVFSDEKKISNIIMLGLLILTILFASMFFRKTLFFIFSIFIFLLLFNFKNKLNLLKFSVLAVLCVIMIINFNPYKMFNSEYLDESDTIFWGQTDYGGLGGEVGFIFPENEKRYNERFKQYLIENKIDTITQETVKQFRSSEVKRFITKEPHKWIFLLIKKTFYTFGSVPQKDGLLMLYDGKIKMPWVFSAFLLQFSFAVILLMFLMSVDLNYKNIINDKYRRIIYFLGAYLIGGICIFSAYQERYRPVIFVCFFIPVIAMNFSKLKNLFRKENRRELIIRIIIVSLLLAVWAYQAYEALYIYHDRYFKVVQ